MAAADEDLVTVAEVREVMRTESGFTDDDDLIQSQITRASVAIMRYTQREFAPTVTAATRRFEVRRRIVSLAPYDLRTATTVTLDPQGSALPLTAGSDYVLRPTTSPDGVFNRLGLARDLDLSSSISDRFGYSEIDVTGDWGFAAVPEDVKHACITTVMAWLQRDVAAFEIDDLEDTDRRFVSPGRTFGLPSSVRARLASYQRMVMA